VISRLSRYPVYGFLLAASGLLLLAGCTGEQDQAVADLAIAYIKRPIPLVANSNPPQMVDSDVRIPTAFSAGGDVYVRDSASPSASERNITSCLTTANPAIAGEVNGDVKDLDTSYDGTKLIFALMKAHIPINNATFAEREKWDIYEYDINAGDCPTTTVIPAGFAPQDGDDLGPTYLPDGRIVFTSNRQTLAGAIQNNEGNVQFPPLDENSNENRSEEALVLHIMDYDGTNIKQISVNQSHDLDPSVLASGEIVFSRWDNMGSSNAINLYKIRPDGTELAALYGVHAHNVGTGNSTVQFLSPRERDDGRILGMIKPFNGSSGGGAPVVMNVAQYADNNQPIWPLQSAGLTGNGQVNAVALGVTTNGSISPAGRFRSVYPIRDGSNRALVSWTQCRLQPLDALGLALGQPIPCPSTIPAGAVEALPIYGIYIYDLGSNTQLPVVIPEEGFIFDEPVVIAVRPEPEFSFDKYPVVGGGLDPTIYAENAGLLHIRSVYDMDGSFDDLGATPAVENLAAMSNPDDVDPVSGTNADRRPARFLRVVKGAYIPEIVDPDMGLDDAAYGVSTQQGMRELLGYVPIEPDGSVLVKVPANVPFAISVVDKDGRRIGGRHQNWLQLQKGQVLQCNGCHDHASTLPAERLPHGYTDAPDPLNTGAGTTGAPFPGTDPAVLAEMGETMAIARIRTACGGDADGPLGLNVAIGSCITLTPDINMRFTDAWTDPAASPTPDLNLLYSFGDPDGLNTPLPENAAAGEICQHDSFSWRGWCRIKINYEEHIQPLWDLSTRVGGVCTDCHNLTGAFTAGQLDLSGIYDVVDEPEHLVSYRELFFGDDQVDATGADVLVSPGNEIDPVTGLVVLDAMGNPIPLPPDSTPTEEGISMSTNGARTVCVGTTCTGYFIDKFLTGSGDPIHEALLTPAEIRLISEWLDMGGQYFNDPFHDDVPTVSLD
jgi:hypothetical protein